jgi:ribosomal protein S18 acetylase RimI-like enzyme
MSDYLIHSGNELYHHGIKGQKWGVRRYQNKDGSLTEIGKKRLKGLSSVSADHSDLMQKVKNISDTPMSIVYQTAKDRGYHKLCSDLINNYKDTVIDDYWLNNAKYILAVDKANDFLAGYVTLMEQKNGKEARIARIEVHDNYRGRGLSSELLERANKGYDKTNSYVYVDNKVASKLFDNHGYKRKDTWFHDSGTAFDIIERDNTKRRKHKQ